MKKRHNVSVFFSVILLLLPLFSQASDTGIGSTAPFFKIESGDGGELSAADIKGKLAVIFYETKDTKEKNRALKEALNTFYAGQAPEAKRLILRIGVINCSKVFFPGAWRKGLKKDSAKEGIVIYGDWDGKMADAYDMKERESNLLIIDKEGIIRYRAAGRIADSEFGAIKELLGDLINKR